MLLGNNLRKASQDSRDLASGLKRVRFHSTSLFASSRRVNSVKLTAVGYLKKPVSCINAKHRLFSYFPAIFRGSRCLSLRPASGRRAGDEGLSGLCIFVFRLTPAAGLTTLGYSHSDAIRILFFGLVRLSRMQQVTKLARKVMSSRDWKSDSR